VVADYVSPLGLRLLITSGSYVPEAKLPSRVIDSMTSVDVDLESHLGEDFGCDGSESICLGTCEECQVGIIYLCFRRFSLEDTHKFAFVGTVEEASRQWLFRELSILPWLHTPASKRFVGRFMGSLCIGLVRFRLMVWPGANSPTVPSSRKAYQTRSPPVSGRFADERSAISGTPKRKAI